MLEEMLEAARNGNVDYFENTFENRLSRGWGGVMLMIALAGEKDVSDWAAAKPLPQIMLERKGRELASCMEQRSNLSEDIWKKGMSVLLQNSDVMAEALLMALKSGPQNLAKLHEAKDITRETCLAKNGAILRAAPAWARRFMIEKCSLSKSDFAASGVVWED